MPEPLDPGVLAELRARLEATQRAAERLAAEAAAARGAPAAPGTPPAGWASPEDHARRNEELAALVALVQAVRELVPDELVDQVRELVRELLVLLRSLVDWWLERLQDPPPSSAAAEVHDVPVTGSGGPTPG